MFYCSILFLILWCTSVGSSIKSANPNTEGDYKNILFIIADDLGFTLKEFF